MQVKSELEEVEQMVVSAVIPAYNEERTIGSVIETLKKIPAVNEIIVISDGSRDNTAGIAREKGTRVVELPVNKGKGAAVKAGLENCSGEVVLLLDADLIGLTVQHVSRLLEPVLAEEADMTVGVFRNGRFRTDFAHKVCPFLSGQRAIKKGLLDEITGMEAAGYGIEIALTVYGDKHNVRMKEIELEDITHVMKEEKLGIIRGVGERLKMYWHIYRGLRLAKR